MTINVYAYTPENSGEEEREDAQRLFRENLSLVLSYQQDIISCSEYFFCPLPIAWCSVLFIAGSGPLCLGYLLLGWSNGTLTEQCVACGGTVLITCFGGSMLSGSNWCFGLCRDCGQSQKSHSAPTVFKDRVDFVLAARKQFPHELSYCEEYDGFVFSWGGNGLKPARKKRLVVKPVVHPVSLDVLLEELKTDKIRKGNPPTARVVPFGYDLELRFKNGVRLTHPVKLVAVKELED